MLTKVHFVIRSAQNFNLQYTLRGYIMRVSEVNNMDRSTDNRSINNCCQSENGGRKKERTDKEFKDLINRLNRIEGQVRGVKNMLVKDAYCVDILTQVAAINAALNSFNKVLLAEHIRTCVAEDIRNGRDDVIDELVATLQKLMR